MTRYGMKEADMQELAGLMKVALEKKVVKDLVVQLRSRFTKVHYAWSILNQSFTKFDIKRIIYIFNQAFFPVPLDVLISSFAR